MDSRPIGVFDSGLGGLTVLEALRRRLPHERFVYLGDVARLPYGTKSSDVVRRYSERCVEFLLRRDVKAVVVACNTASAAALPQLRERCPVPVFGVVEAGVRAALGSWRDGTVIVCATKSTIDSGEYARRLAAVRPAGRVVSLACPLLVPLAEAGWFDDTVTALVIERYLHEAGIEEADAVLFGCTHYPLLLPSFRRVVPSSVALVHGADEVARELAVFLSENGTLAPEGAGTVTLLATDRVEATLPLLAGLHSVEPFALVDLEG